MPFPWERDKSRESDGGDGLKKLEELTTKFASVEGAVTETKTELESIKGQLSKLDDVSTFINEQRQAKARAEQEAQRRQRQENLEDEDATLASNLLADPRATINAVTKEQRDSILAIRSRQVRQEVFSDPDNLEKFKYYSGDIRKEVDALIDAQNLSFQTNAQSVENCYYTVLGRHSHEIAEGKIKSRFASSGGGSSSTGNTTTSTSTPELPRLTEDMKRAAKLLDFTPEEYQQMVASYDTEVV